MAASELKLRTAVCCVVAVDEIRFTKELEDVKLDKVNVDVCLECELSKDGQKVEWFKDSKKIRADMEHDIQDEGKTHRLIIKKATPKDIGTYRADYTHLSTSAKLSIEGRITPVLLNHAVARDHAIIAEGFGSVVNFS